MPLTLPAQGLPEPVDDASGVELPLRFAEAPQQVRAVTARHDKPGIPGHARRSHRTPPTSQSCSEDLP